MKKTISVLGSTGSIGTQALEVIEGLNYRVAALTASCNTVLLEKQIRKFKPKFAAMLSEKASAELKIKVSDTSTKVLSGRKGIEEIAALGTDVVLNSIVGIAGLAPTLYAIDAGSAIALANKETLVTAGDIVIKRAKKRGVKIYPVDSEHSAIFQCLHASPRKALSRIILTASGGPFLGKTKEELFEVKKQEALKHPNWSMGSKISVDSATLMNKGLEVIEAVHLFGLPQEKIDVVVHPQSIVHSLVEWCDGAMLAQLGTPDMKIPIQYALTCPGRVPSSSKPLSLTEIGTLTFMEPDRNTFTCLASCEKAIGMGGLYPAAVNGANEQAVHLFLQDKISFLDIAELVEETLSLRFPTSYSTVDQIFEADAVAREFVRQKAL